MKLLYAVKQFVYPDLNIDFIKNIGKFPMDDARKMKELEKINVVMKTILNANHKFLTCNCREDLASENFTYLPVSDMIVKEIAKPVRSYKQEIDDSD